ncbi:hybrid sensor histidine kinase/response regulator [Pseudomonas sp. GD03944]|uniref:ATP-binding response regulator n=1 Tax=Pseudomonas sp. GD03944 TaxID=2975409 RepID=UPI002448C408|nr:hybrid sensor histidine kinase/response regulator [Pseudomonas sp. GD03944]MDH1265019.1 hybrid sensor histidine kinase/response regulator [Pseudomonas sp. GD03944]
MPATPPRPHDTERAQAVVRLVIAPLATGYMLWTYHEAMLTAQATWLLVSASSLFCVASLVLWLDIVRRPGNRPRRRLFAVLIDYSCITVTLAFGGEAMLPVYAILLWVTVGYGLRYGSRYLLLATIAALGSLALTTSISAYWQAQPLLVVTLLLTTVVVPAYMNALLKRSRLSAEAERAANLAKSQFLAQASHDLRQPIHSISLFTACLRDGTLDAEQGRLVDNIDKSLHSVSRLFRSILDMYSLESGRVAPQLETLALHTLLQQLVQQNTEAARWAGVEVRLHCPPLQVRADPALLSTMLQNLLSNALKYAPGRPVLIGCRRREGGVSIELYDQGRGIAKRHLDSVFEEFYRVRQVRDNDVEGMGLGLAIVKRLGDLMGLEIRMRSEEGRGTLVAIDGLQPVQAPVVASPAVKREPLAPRMLDGLRVCLIEDDDNVRTATASLLQKWGCEVETYASIPHAARPFDLLITDFDLGTEASGADCIAYVRQLRGRDIPAVVLTGHDVGRVQAAVNDAVIPVLSKPVHPAELRSLLVALRLEQPAL